jgi:hypothetical protein
MALSDVEKQAARTKRIRDAKLAQRKVVGHPDDFPAIRKYAKKLYEKKGITL